MLASRLRFSCPRVTATTSRWMSSSSCLRSKKDSQDETVTDRMSMKGKTVLVTGGGRGIGFAVTKAIAQLGGHVAVVDALPEPVDEFHSLGDKYGVKAFYTSGDVTQEQSLQDAFAAAVDAVGPLSGCVAAAGIAIDKPFFDHKWDECQRVLQVNTMGCFWTARLAAESMAKSGNGGSIVMIASIAAQGVKVPMQNISIYNMSKAAVKGLAGPLAVELAPFNIRVNTISPGVIMSPMTDALKTQYPELLRMFENAAPAKRIGQPSDLTPAIIYLLSDAASYTTGSDLLITGGMHAGTSVDWISKS